MNKATDAAPRMSLRTILGFAAGALPLSAMGTAMGISVQPYYAQTLGLGLIPIAIAFCVVRIVDSVVDPALAVAMDRTRTRIGRYRPWMLIGMPVLMLAVFQLFMAKQGVNLIYLMIWYFVFALGGSIVGLSRGAWSANLITRYDQRARFYGYLGFISVIGTLIVLGTPVISSQIDRLFHFHARPNDVQLMGWTVLALIPIGTLITAIFVREPITVDTSAHFFKWADFRDIARKPEVIRLAISQFALTLSPGWMGNLYIFFFTAARGFTSAQAYLLLIIYVLSGVFGAPLIGYLGGRFSKHRTMIATTIGYSLGLCTVLVAPKGDNPLGFIIGVPIMVWCGFMGNGFDLMTGAMMADVGDQVRLEQGKERMAVLFAITGLAGKWAAAGAVIISYPLLAWIGFQPPLGAHNTPAALRGLEIVFIAGPIFWCVVGGLCFLGWKLDATKHASIREKLEARDALLAQQSALDNPAVHHGVLDAEVVRS